MEDLTLVIVAPGEQTPEQQAQALVDLAQALGLLKGRDPRVLYDYLLTPAGREWVAQRTRYAEVCHE